MGYHLIHIYTSINNNKKMERLSPLTLVFLVTLHYSCYSLFVPGSLCLFCMILYEYLHMFLHCSLLQSPNQRVVDQPLVPSSLSAVIEPVSDTSFVGLSFFNKVTITGPFSPCLQL